MEVEIDIQDIPTKKEHISYYSASFVKDKTPGK